MPWTQSTSAAELRSPDRARAARVLRVERGGLPVGPLAANGTGGAHASALSAVLELAGCFALAPALADDEHAVSHAVALQLIGPAAACSQVRATGQLDRRGRRSAFVSAVAQVDDVVVARTQITKTVVPWG